MKEKFKKILYPICTLLRIWLGYEWLMAGYEKITGVGWIGSKSGVAITGFLNGAVAKAGGEHPAVQSWYADFIKNVALPNAKIFSYVVAFGEILVGISLILGALTIVGLIAGAFMNLNYLLAGTTSTNPNMYTIAVILLFAGAYAYKIGLDYLLIPLFQKLIGRKTNIENIN